jgi:hypothetical protein
MRYERVVTPPPIRPATPADAPALTALINDAYEVETDSDSSRTSPSLDAKAP